MIVRIDARGRRKLAGPAVRGRHGPAGWWQTVTLAPGKARLLAQWSGECEVPTAYLVDAHTGRLAALGRDRAGRRVESRALGWRSRTPLVSLPRSVCTYSADRPGVYAFDRRGEGRRIYAFTRVGLAAARLWR